MTKNTTVNVDIIEFATKAAQKKIKELEKENKALSKKIESLETERSNLIDKLDGAIELTDKEASYINNFIENKLDNINHITSLMHNLKKSLNIRDFAFFVEELADHYEYNEWGKNDTVKNFCEVMEKILEIKGYR